MLSQASLAIRGAQYGWSINDTPDPVLIDIFTIYTDVYTESERHKKGTRCEPNEGRSRSGWRLKLDLVSVKGRYKVGPFETETERSNGPQKSARAACKI